MNHNTDLVISIYIFGFLAILNMALCSFKDPGFMKDLVRYQIDMELVEENKPKFYTHRECATCNIIRPPLASHCSSCGYCVKGYDHRIILK